VVWVQQQGQEFLGINSKLNLCNGQRIFETNHYSKASSHSCPSLSRQ